MKNKKHLDLFSKKLFPEKEAWLKYQNDPNTKVFDVEKFDLNIFKENMSNNISTVIFHNNKKASPLQINQVKELRNELKNNGNKVLFYLEKLEKVD